MLCHPLHALGTPNVSPYRMSRKKTTCVAIVRNKVDTRMSQNSGPVNTQPMNFVRYRIWVDTCNDQNWSPATGKVAGAPMSSRKWQKGKRVFMQTRLMKSLISCLMGKFQQNQLI